MASRKIIYVFATILIIMSLLVFLPSCSDPKVPDSYCITEDPDLGEVLNKSGAYAFSYIHVQGQRIAAIDELGYRYFYIYDAAKRLESIIDEENRTIWINNCNLKPQI